jgi:hypothetical protein
MRQKDIWRADEDSLVIDLRNSACAASAVVFNRSAAGYHSEIKTLTRRYRCLWNFGN